MGADKLLKDVSVRAGNHKLAFDLHLQGLAEQLHTGTKPSGRLRTWSHGLFRLRHRAVDWRWLSGVGGWEIA